MKNSVKIAFIILVMLGSISCSESNFIEGKWKEYWNVGQVNNIDYQDIFIIKKVSGKLQITCENYEKYEISKVLFDGNELSFEILNTYKNDIMPYAMKISKDGKWLEGSAIDVKGVKTKVKWEKCDKIQK